MWVEYIMSRPAPHPLVFEKKMLLEHFKELGKLDKDFVMMHVYNFGKTSEKNFRDGARKYSFKYAKEKGWIRAEVTLREIYQNKPNRLGAINDPFDMVNNQIIVQNVVAQNVGINVKIEENIVPNKSL